MTGPRIIGLVLMLLGFFAAAFVSVRHADGEGLEWQSIEWGWYLLAFLCGAVGVVLLRLTVKDAATQSEKVGSDLSTLDASLDVLVDKLLTFKREKGEIDTHDIHGKIDEQLAEHLGLFADAREALIHRYGLQPYADLMSKFALGERNINRAWSASADGYVDEVWASLDRAEKQMSSAQSLLRQYQRTKAT